MKRYIKSFNYEVDEYGYPTYDGISFVSDSDMLDYIADDGEAEVTVDDEAEVVIDEPVEYVVRNINGPQYRGDYYATTGRYVRGGRVADCYESEADRFTLQAARVEVNRRNRRCRKGNPWIYERAE